MSSALAIAIRKRRRWPTRLVYRALDLTSAISLAVALLIFAGRFFLPFGWICGFPGALEAHRVRRAWELFQCELADWRTGYELRPVSPPEWASLASDITFTVLEDTLVALLVSHVGQ